MCTMDSGLKLEQKSLINELTQGMEIAKQLRFHLNSASSAENRQLLLQRILSSYEKSLLILKSSAPTTGMTESSISGDGSPRSEDCNGGGFKDHHQDQNVVSKKRKVLPTWTDQVRISSENGFEGPIDDGYSWRKYGQKDILGTKYPRSYYRCTNRNSQNCWATKQVQRSDDDPTVFEIIYKGRHECNQTPHTAPPAPPPPASLDKQNNHHQPPNNMHFRTSLTVNTHDLDTKDMTSPLTSPSTSFEWMKSQNQNQNQNFPISKHVHDEYQDSFSPYQMMNNFGVFHDLQHSGSELTEIISTNNSVTNSPILDLGFSIDSVVDLDPNFPFDTPGYFY
ncbi:probable WRKY transcription factor 41 [Camellia sinensis]|uniref:probable WRKY transcription factor 41 n=1 Tax=Camellia sinensis TaxID=4442 RepID=UPI001035CB62|nr:probable WRKY transcription factor 41 [Camellia sinensis]